MEMSIKLISNQHTHAHTHTYTHTHNTRRTWHGKVYKKEHSQPRSEILRFISINRRLFNDSLALMRDKEYEWETVAKEYVYLQLCGAHVARVLA